jgi:hypothetical protein
MSEAPRPVTFEPPSGKRLIISTLAAAIVAAIVLLTAVLPAEFGIDPTGLGAAMGLTALNEPTRTIAVTDVIGGNESVVELEIPDYGEPVPLPNPAVHQSEDAPPRSDQFTVTIPAEGETEIKTVLRTGKVVVYAWRTDRGTIYSDFHGHNPEFGDDFWVRYEEHQEGSGQSGSLVAPFDGEHGWYWLNYNDFPVTVTLDVTGFYDDTVDYGIFGQ